MCLRAQGFDNNNRGVVRLGRAHGISDNDRGIGGGRVIDDASEGSETTTKAAGAR